MDEKSLKDVTAVPSYSVRKTLNKYFLGEILNYLCVSCYLTLSIPFFVLQAKLERTQLKAWYYKYHIYCFLLIQ